MSKVKLKPCPFCGAKPFLLINSSAERIYVKIKCDRCNVERLDIIAGLCTWGELECCKDRVLEKWNTRYTENPSQINENAAQAKKIQEFDKLHSETKERISSDFQQFREVRK